MVTTAPPAQAQTDRVLCVLFRSGGERYAIKASDVLKVVGQTRLCRLPRLPPAVLGITQHRGRIVTVFDAAVLLLGGARRDQSDAQRVLVLDRLQRNLGLLVDSVDEIQPLRLTAQGPPGAHPALHVVQHQGTATNAIQTDRLLEAILAVHGDGGPS